MEVKGIWPLVLGLPLLVGCGQSGRLRVDSGLDERSSTLGSPGNGTLELADGKLIVEAASIAVSEIDFEGGDEDEREAELGAADIDVSLDGDLTTVAADSVEAGTYHTLGLELRSGGDSIRVSGTYDGADFTYSTDLSPELEFSLKPQVDVPAKGEARVGVTFDVGAWLVDADGTVLDPTNTANREAIDANIVASMAANAEIELSDED